MTTEVFCELSLRLLLTGLALLLKTALHLGSVDPADQAMTIRPKLPLIAIVGRGKSAPFWRAVVGSHETIVWWGG